MFTQTGFIPQEGFSQDPAYEEVCEQFEVLDRTESRGELRELADAREDLKLAIAALQAADSKTSQLQDNISVLESQRRTAIGTLKAKIEAMNIVLANERAKTGALTNAIQSLEGKVQAEKADKKQIISQLDQARAEKQQVSLKLDDLRGKSGYLEPRPNNSVWIMLICFGNTYITKPEVVERCYQYAHSKQTFRFNPEWFHGIDPMPGVEKTVFILYKYNNTGLIRCLHAVEHKDVHFDLK